MAKKEIIGGIVEKSLREIVSNKDFSEEEADIILGNSLKLVALSIGGFVSISSTDDIERVINVIEGNSNVH